MAGEAETAKQEIGFVVGPGAAAMFEKLQAGFGVNSNAAVLRKALALADIAAGNADDDHILRIIDQRNNHLEVQLAKAQNDS